MSKIHKVENYCLAPPAPRCLHWKDFLSPLDPMFPCWDIREEQLEKTIAYTQTLQYWAEKSNPPMPGQPYLLARCILELREMMEWYISFSDDTILNSVASLEGFLKDWTKITIPRDAQPAFTNVPTKEIAVEEAALIRGSLRNQLHPRYCMRSR